MAKELSEELKIETKVIKELPCYQYQLEDMTILEFYPCHVEIIHGKPKALEHMSIKYVNIDAIGDYELAPPNYQALERLKVYYAKDP